MGRSRRRIEYNYKYELLRAQTIYVPKEFHFRSIVIDHNHICISVDGWTDTKGAVEYLLLVDYEYKPTVLDISQGLQMVRLAHPKGIGVGGHSNYEIRWMEATPFHKRLLEPYLATALNQPIRVPPTAVTPSVNKRYRFDDPF